MDLGLSGKALVTGGSKGIGEAITRTLMAEVLHRYLNTLHRKVKR